MLSNITFYFIPLLNPDGCEKMIRRNAAGIDINRDYQRMQSPESIILKNLANEIKPDFAFNMHDQDYRWSVGDTSKLATLSFLAPTSDKDKTITETRQKAVKLISALNKELEKVVNGQIARYPDDFEPRSFGDNFAKNYSTILIESGRHPGDINKYFTRKLNYAALITAFKQIAAESYKNASVEEYFSIPTNGNFLYDLILRNVTYKTNNTSVQLDVCINREEVYFADERIPYLRSNIEDIGDCSNVKGIEELDCTGMILSTDSLVKEDYKNDLLINNDHNELLAQGILFVKTKIKLNCPYVKTSINYISEQNTEFNVFDLGHPANFVLSKDDIIEYVVFNGLCKKNDKINETNINGLCFE